MKHISLLTFLLLGALIGSAQQAAVNVPPNVILVLTDDQGIGDLGCHGNPWLKTPNIDNFYRQSVRMTDFHVSPVCTPTRAALMTGQYPINNGAWATFKGRDALTGNTVTMADVFQQNGYKTAMFGKWHLGDNYPVRPTDSGFDLAVHHLAGGVGELSDYWGNSYFDDVYYVNNQPRQFDGYCTDVWFNETISFIDQHKEQPFFIYLPTNAPHDPLIVAEKYAKPYQHLEGDKIISADLYGMIANIDENFGKLLQFLEDEKLADNTILIFMTDNGTRFGYSRNGKFGYNMGLRGIKGDKPEGGHRVPFFIRWPNGDIQGGKDLSELAAHVDLLPTLAGLCNLKLPEQIQLDGIDFSTLLTQKNNPLQDRTVFVHHRQDWRPPMPVEHTCILQNNWRLINGTELFDIEKDRKQRHDLAAQYPEVVQQLLQGNQKFIKAAQNNRIYDELPVAVIGNPAQKEIKLTIQHAIGEDRGIWKPEQVAAGMKNKNNAHALQVDSPGQYRISCRRWPKECAGPMHGIPAENPKGRFEYQPIQPEKVRIRIANQLHEKEVDPRADEVSFLVTLGEGKTMLTTDFIEGSDTYGVYYSYIQKLD